MSDLLSQDIVGQFRSAMRDIADTFYHTPVTLRRAAGGDVPLMAGKRPMETGDNGEVHGELYQRDERRETVERWQLSFNRDYLAEQGLIHPVTGELLITIDDEVLLDGRQFYISQLTDKAIFLGLPISVVLTVVR